MKYTTTISDSQIGKLLGEIHNPANDHSKFGRHSTMLLTKSLAASPPRCSAKQKQIVSPMLREDTRHFLKESPITCFDIMATAHPRRARGACAPMTHGKDRQSLRADAAPRFCVYVGDAEAEEDAKP